MKKTSEKWLEESEWVIVDPDGWDRKDFGYSFYMEHITEEEFENRMAHSSIVPRNPRWEDFYVTE